VTPLYDGDPGPAGVSTRTSRVAGASVTWYTPDTPGPWPVVIWSHGFARGPQHHETAARFAASWGFLVATPALPNFADHAANGRFLAEDLLPAAVTASGQADPPVALVGHSAGGLASVIASASASGVDAYVGLDPVDSGSLGADAARRVSAPALILHGEAGSCNAEANSSAWRFSGTAWSVDVNGASHCDFESDSDGLCTSFCGGEDAAIRELSLAYATAWLLQQLGGADASAWVEGGSQADADRSARRLSW
jgi:dienelactone hydrolase